MEILNRNIANSQLVKAKAKNYLRGEIPLEPLKKAVFSILLWENENEASPDFLHILEGII